MLTYRVGWLGLGLYGCSRIQACTIPVILPGFPGGTCAAARPGIFRAQGRADFEHVQDNFEHDHDNLRAQP